MNKYITKFFKKFSQIQAHELSATLVAFTMVFILMASYFILRPVRDAMASDWSDSEVSFLWNLQFFVSIAIVALYGFIISKFQFKHVVPIVYSSFAASFLAFYLITKNLSDSIFIDKAFYIWGSAFSLFHLSVFWSFMSDTFSKEQGKRLFSVISAGASLGAIIGPMIPALFAEILGVDNLMLIAAAGLLLVIPLVLSIYHLKSKQLKNNDIHADLAPYKLKNSWYSGFKAVLANRYLLAIAAFILLYVFIGSFVYFEQKNLLAEYARSQRAEILGSIDWIVNSLTFLMAFFITGRIVKKFGMALTLSLMPLLLFFGMVVLAFAPMIVIVLAIQITRRVGNYSVTRPAREMLFTQVTADERFKAKPVIDIVVYRGGDAISGTLFATLTETFGMGLVAVSLVGAFIASIWTWLAIRIGKLYEN
jgi:AAA family ATP:ADP antiporter